MFWLGLFLAASAAGARQLLADLARFAGAALALSGVAVVLLAQLGDAQIKNLTDRLNNLVGGGGFGGKSVDPTTRQQLQGASLINSMSANVNIPAGAPVGQEWRIEISGNGTWMTGGAGNWVQTMIWIPGASSTGGTATPCLTQTGQGDTGFGAGAGFSFRLVGTITVRLPGVVICQLAVTFSQTGQGTIVGYVMESADDQVQLGALGVASIAMARGANGPTNVITHRSVTESYGP
jgi:hypothetical protein